MNAYPTVRVGDVLRLARRPVAVEIDREYDEIGVRSFGRGIFHKDPVEGGALNQKRVFRIEPGDLVISNVFAWEGAIAVASQAESGRIGSHRFMTFVPIAERIDTAWATWFFRSDPGMKLIRRASPGSAGRNRTLAIKRFEALEIPLPPIEEQRRVARRLDSISSLRQEVDRRSSSANTMVRALAISITNRPDMNAAAKARLGWTKTDLASILTPATEPVDVEPDRSYPNLGIRSFGNGVFRKPDIDGGATSARSLHRVRAGQVIYSRLFAFEGAYGLVTPEFHGHFVSNEFPAFDVDADSVDAQWLVTYLRSPDRWRELAATSKGLGVRRRRVPVEAVLGYAVWLPPLLQQRAMMRLLDRLHLTSDARSAAQKRIEALLPSAVNLAFPSAG